MFAGHLAVALATKESQPKIPLAVLVAASFGLDLIWPVLLFAGVEVVSVAPGDTAFTPLEFELYPWSHSLAMTLAWSLVVGIGVYIWLRAVRPAIVVAAVVASHWLLDYITHRPDLPLWPGSAKVGLGMWNTIPGTLILEGAMFVAAIVLYARASQPRDAIGRWAFWALVLLVGAIWASQPWSPPPPSAKAVAAVSMAMWLLPPWAGWIERHRPMVED